MNKKSSAFAFIVSAALICCFLLEMLGMYSDSTMDRDKTLSGHSDHWDVYITMVDGGITRIVMGPAVKFYFPDSIEIEIRSHNHLLYKDKLFIQRPQNSYTIKFSTIKSAYKAGEDLTFVVYYNGLSEKVKLHDDPL